MVGDFPLPLNDPVGSLPVRTMPSLREIFSGAHYLPQDEVSNVEVSTPDFGVVVLGHEILVLF